MTLGLAFGLYTSHMTDKITTTSSGLACHNVHKLHEV